MTTLLAVYNSDRCVGRCDATCYMAKGKQCHCICGGKNHGVGKDKAAENVREKIVPRMDDIDLYVSVNEIQGDVAVIDRIEIPDSRVARSHAYMKINQIDLFAEGA